MAAITSALHNTLPNRRRRVRHKIQAPAYATFPAESSAMLDLHQVIDISEDGVAIQCISPLSPATQVNLCLDLADCPQQIFTTGKVVWSAGSGRAGLLFNELLPSSLGLLREWLFVNAMTGATYAQSEPDRHEAPILKLPVVAPPDELEQLESGPAPVAESFPSPHDYTDTLAAVTAVQQQVEALGADLPAVLQLIAERAHTLLLASSAAIALADSDPDFMTCRASSGESAPPIGTRLQVGSGFSGECVRTALPLNCDDTELDPRVDLENCRAMGIRSILAVPIISHQKSIGLVEVCSDHPSMFSESELAILQRLAETALAAVNRASRTHNDVDPNRNTEDRNGDDGKHDEQQRVDRRNVGRKNVDRNNEDRNNEDRKNEDRKNEDLKREDSSPLAADSAPTNFSPAPGSILFASVPSEKAASEKDACEEEDVTEKQERAEKETESEKEGFSISLPLSHLYLMISALAVTVFGIGYASAPLIYSKLQQHNASPPQTVLAASQPDTSATSAPSVETASLDQLKEMADNDDPNAENALGLRYFQGDQKNNLPRDEAQAFQWFLKAADRGNLPAQAKLGSLYWTGRGVHKDLSQAYFWTVLARARGDVDSKNRAALLASGLTHTQSRAIEQQADAWLQQNITNWKPSAGQ